MSANSKKKRKPFIRSTSGSLARELIRLAALPDTDPEIAEWFRNLVKGNRKK